MSLNPAAASWSPIPFEYSSEPNTNSPSEEGDGDLPIDSHRSRCSPSNLLQARSSGTSPATGSSEPVPRGAATPHGAAPGEAIGWVRTRVQDSEREVPHLATAPFEYTSQSKASGLSEEADVHPCHYRQNRLQEAQGRESRVAAQLRGLGATAVPQPATYLVRSESQGLEREIPQSVPAHSECTTGQLAKSHPGEDRPDVSAGTFRHAFLEQEQGRVGRVAPQAGRLGATAALQGAISRRGSEAYDSEPEGHHLAPADTVIEQQYGRAGSSVHLASRMGGVPLGDGRHTGPHTQDQRSSLEEDLRAISRPGSMSRLPEERVPFLAPADTVIEQCSEPTPTKEDDVGLLPPSPSYRSGAPLRRSFGQEEELNVTFVKHAHKRSSSLPTQKPLKSALSPPRTPGAQKKKAHFRQDEYFETFDDDRGPEDAELRRNSGDQGSMVAQADDEQDDSPADSSGSDNDDPADSADDEADEDGLAGRPGDELYYSDLSGSLDDEADDAAAEIEEDAIATRNTTLGPEGAEDKSSDSETDNDGLTGDAGDQVDEDDEPENDDVAGSMEEEDADCDRPADSFDEEAGYAATGTVKDTIGTHTTSSDIDLIMPVIGRRTSDPPTRGRLDMAQPSVQRRASSMTDMHKMKSRLRLPGFMRKASPADCAITTCSVRAAESPRLNTVYEHPAARWQTDNYDKKTVMTAQTVTSGEGTYQMIWEEPPNEDIGSETTLIEQPAFLEDPEQDDSLVAHVDRSPSPLAKAKTKLAAWSWAKEMEQEDDDGESQGIPLMPLDDEDEADRNPWASTRALYSPEVDSPEADVESPPAPPNTEQTSASSSKRPSGLHTPHYEPEITIQEEDEGEDHGIDEVDEDAPLEMQIKSAFRRNRSRSAPTAGDYLSVPGSGYGRPPSPRIICPVPRHHSNLAEEDEHFQGHRDSVDVYHKRMNDKEHRMNQMLLNTRDSFVLTKSKYDAMHPSKTVAGAAPSIQWSRFGGLSPILDASPPDGNGHIAWKGRSKLDQSQRSEDIEEPVLGSAVGKHACPMCKSERPKWLKARYMKDKSGMITLQLLDEEALD